MGTWVTIQELMLGVVDPNQLNFWQSGGIKEIFLWWLSEFILNISCSSIYV